MDPDVCMRELIEAAGSGWRATDPDTLLDRANALLTWFRRGGCPPVDWTVQEARELATTATLIGASTNNFHQQIQAHNRAAKKDQT